MQKPGFWLDRRLRQALAGGVRLCQRRQGRLLNLMPTDCALGVVLVRRNQQTAAFGAGLGHGALPRREITRRIIGASVEYPPLAGLALGQFAAAFGALDANFLQPRLGVAALREVRTADEFAVAAVPDDERVARLRAIPPDHFRFRLDLEIGRAHV